MVTCKGPSRSLPLSGHNYSQPVRPLKCPSLETVGEPRGLFTGSLERTALSSLPTRPAPGCGQRPAPPFADEQTDAGTLAVALARPPGRGGRDSPTPLRPEHDVTVREPASV